MVYIVGKWVPGGSWSVEGVYDKKEDADKASIENWFVMPVEKNVKLEEKIVGYYPHN